MFGWMRQFYTVIFNLKYQNDINISEKKVSYKS